MSSMCAQRNIARQNTGITSRCLKVSKNHFSIAGDDVEAEHHLIPYGIVKGCHVSTRRCLRAV
jgi:hypothetical protein